jgi:ABC-type Fe2+-enterobactin transport system substrate-binding protein
MTSLGDSAEKMDVPATMTFEPGVKAAFTTRRYDERQQLFRQLTSLCAITDVTATHSTVDLNVHLVAILFSQLLDFLQTLWHELLTALSRVDGHDQQEVGCIRQFRGDH